MRAFVSLMLLGMMGVTGGCGLYGTNTEREAAAELGGTARSTAERPSPITSHATEGSALTVNIGDKALKEMRLKEETALGLNTSHDFALSSHNPWTILLVAGGILLTVYAAKQVWSAIRNTSAGKALAMADHALSAQVDKVRERMQTETDRGTLTELAKQETSLQREREKLATVGLTGKAA